MISLFSFFVSSWKSEIECNKFTLSSAESDFPISSSDSNIAATVPSVLHAIRMVWSLILLHDKSKTLSLNRSFITANGRLKVVSQIEIDLSREPIAKQQYCVFFDESFRCKIDWLKRTQFTAFRWPTKSMSHFQPLLRSIICAVGPPWEQWW